MAKIVLGIGTSHSPLLTFDSPTWIERAGDDMRNAALNMSDGRDLSYADLLAERGPVHAKDARQEHLGQQSKRAQANLDRIADAIARVDPDIMLVIGDDQEELFEAGNMPSVAIFQGDEVVMRPLGEIVEQPPPWLRAAIAGCAMDTDHHFPAAPEFAHDLITRLMDAGVDLAVASKIRDPRAAAFGHAYGFVAHRLLRKQVPIVPVLLNTYYPPNVVRPGRCFDIGQSIANAIAAMASPLRVAVVASGGLSHFVTDADLDCAVLEALRIGDEKFLRSVPMAALRAGSSEILCWIMAGGAMTDLRHAWSDYLPVYRTPAGSGIGLAFGVWTPDGTDGPAVTASDRRHSKGSS